MFALWNKARRRCLLRSPTDKELGYYLASFSAGFHRGAGDVRARIHGIEWTRMIALISAQLVEDHSAIEAGCWLAGVRAGRKAAAAGNDDQPGIVNKLFCQAWESEQVAKCALECAPDSVHLRMVLKACWKRKAAPIRDRLLNKPAN
jgi:hypothetical protein